MQRTDNTGHFQARPGPLDAVVECGHSTATYRIPTGAGAVGVPANGSVGYSAGGFRFLPDRHWNASDASGFGTKHDIYLEDAVPEYPQSGDRIRGRRNIQITRTN